MLRVGQLLLIGPLVYLGIFFLYPLISILSHSLSEHSALDLAPFWTLLGDRYYLGRIWFTIWQALVSTVLTLVIGLPAAFLFAKYDFPGKTLLKALTTVPFVMPAIVVAMGFLALFGPRGIVNEFLMSVFNLDVPPLRITNTLTAIFVAHVFYNYSIVVRIVSAFWANLDKSVEETAKLLGAGRLRTFFNVTLPMLFPSLASAALLAFTFSFTSFGVVLVLAGPQFATLDVTIYELTVQLFRLPLAAALSIIQLIFSYIFLFMYSRIQEKSVSRIDPKPNATSLTRKFSKTDKLFVSVMVIIMLLILSPLAALVERAFATGSGYSLEHFKGLFINEQHSYFFLPPVMILWNSLRSAIFTVGIALFLGTIVSYFLARFRLKKRRGVMDALFMLPLGVSAVIMGYGFLLAFNRPPWDMRSSWVILAIAHSLIAYPFVVRSILPVLRGLNPNLREAAFMLGASPAQAFLFIDVPLIYRALLVGAIFAFAVSMGEFGASLLLVRPEYTTIPVSIFRLLSQPGGTKFGEALAMSSLLMGVVAIGFIAIERFRYRNVGAF